MRHACVAFAAFIVCAAAFSARGDEAQPIRIGYAISKTGAYAGGANTSTLPNYQLWVKDVNGAGGLMLKDGRRHPIEVIEYDDRSDPIEAQNAIERLATVDKVDFMLPPWGNNLNLVAAPFFNRYGYPQLCGAASFAEVSEWAKSAPWSFLALGLPTHIAESLVGILVQLRQSGKIENSVAMAYVADSFGTSLSAPARAALRREKFNVVYDRTYPVGSRDMKPVIVGAATSKPDVFLAFSYPGDTFGITATAIELGFDPKVFFAGIGVAYPTFKQQFGARADGIFGMGGWDASLPALQAYFKRHVAVIGREPDRFISPVTYATLQILQQAIERAGTLERIAVLEQIRIGTFETQMGPLRYDGNVLDRHWDVGQWQHGEFYGVAPAGMTGARTLVFPKPPWRLAE
jgi:branched-chain amino acid transport system substrate-binding protein